MVSSTRAPASAAPVRVGVVTVVRLSPFKPVSDASAKPPDVATLRNVSTEKELPDLTATLPARSVTVITGTWVPSGKFTAGVCDARLTSHTPCALARVVKVRPAICTSTCAWASAWPLRMGSAWLVTPSVNDQPASLLLSNPPPIAASEGGVLSTEKAVTCPELGCSCDPSRLL